MPLVISSTISRRPSTTISRPIVLRFAYSCRWIGDSRPCASIAVSMYLTRVREWPRHCYGAPASVSHPLLVNREVLIRSRSTWGKELSRSLAFQLDLPGIEQRDVEVAIRGRLLVVYARKDKIAYKWSTDVGGQAKVSTLIPERSSVTDLTSPNKSNAG